MLVWSLLIFLKNPVFWYFGSNSNFMWTKPKGSVVEEWELVSFSLEWPNIHTMQQVIWNDALFLSQARWHSGEHFIHKKVMFTTWIWLCRFKESSQTIRHKSENIQLTWNFHFFCQIRQVNMTDSSTMTVKDRRASSENNCIERTLHVYAEKTHTMTRKHCERILLTGYTLFLSQK